MKKILSVLLILIFSIMAISFAYTDDSDEATDNDKQEAATDDESNTAEEKEKNALSADSDEEPLLGTAEGDSESSDDNLPYSVPIYEAYDVDNSGGFSWSLPIDIPAGTNGMQPQLSVSYNSLARNGMIGKGFSLNGLGTIERDDRYPVNWTSADHFSFNGQKLIKDSTGKYHCETENYLVIEHITSSGDYWTVKSQDGVIRYFGNSPDSFINAVGEDISNKARLWALHKVEDPFGNYYEIDYSEDTISGDYYPEIITYTKGNGISTYKTVEFSYEGRPDTVLRFDPSRVEMDKRLDFIKICVNGTQTIRYEFLYSDNGLSAVDGSLLENIRIYGKGDALFPQKYKFEWSIADGNVAMWTHSLDIGRKTTMSFRLADFNGDGRTDLFRIGESSCYIGLAEETGNIHLWDHILGAGEGSTMSFQFGDFNGDGRTDVFRIHESQCWIGLADETGDIEVWSHTIAAGEGETMSFQLGDFNGDGRTDVFRAGESECWIGLADETGDITIWSHTIAAGEGETMSFQLGDFNGDGRTDIIRVGKYSSHIGLADETGDIVLWSHPVDMGEGNTMAIRLGDFNGDGKTDVFRIGESKCWIGLADESGDIELWSHTVEAGKGTDENKIYTFQFGDFNGDGRTDIFRLGKLTNYEQRVDETGDIGLADESGDIKVWSHSWSLGTGIDPESPRYYWPGDTNGDGRTDIFQSGKLTCNIGLANGNPSAITCATNLTGGEILVDYIPDSHMAGAVQPEHNVYENRANSSTRFLVISIELQSMPGNAQNISSISSYDFTNGRFINGTRSEQKPLGFEKIRKTNADGTYSDTYYHCGSNITQKKIFAGIPWKTRNFGADNKLYLENEKSFNSRAVSDSAGNPVSGVHFPYLTKEVERIYNGGTSSVNYATTYGSWDEWGHPTVIENTGECDADGVDKKDSNNITILNDNTKTEIHYILRNSSRYIVKPEWVKTWAYELFPDDGTSALNIATHTAYTYNTNGFCTEEKNYYDATHYLTSTYTPDNWGNVSTQTIHGIATSFTYDDYKAQIKTVTDADNNTTTYNYNNLCLLEDIADIWGKHWKTRYDSFNRVVKEIGPDDDDSYPGKKYDYNDTFDITQGDLYSIQTSIKDSQYGYLESIEYFDGLGRTVQTKIEDVGGQYRTVDSFFDDKGRPWKTSVMYRTNTLSFEGLDDNAKYTELAYDSAGRVSKTYNTDRTFKEIVYTARGQYERDENDHAAYRGKTIWGDVVLTYDTVWATLMNATDKSTYQYSRTDMCPASDGMAIRDSLGHYIFIEKDQLGRNVRYQDPDKGEWSYTYDLTNGLLKTQTDAKGNVITFQYDDMGRVIQKDLSSGPSTLYTYGTSGFGKERLISINYGSGTDEMTYNNLGLIVSHTRTIDGLSRTMTYTYDQMDRISTITYPDGEVVTYSYLNDGNLDSLKGVIGGCQNTYLNSTSYEPDGKISQTMLGDNVVAVDYTYNDSTFRLEEILANNGSIMNYHYVYDDVGNITYKTDYHNRNYDESYTYDYLNRLDTATSSTGYYGKIDYEYNSINNITKKTYNDNTGTAKDYTYYADKIHAVHTYDGYTYNYDANGNMTGKSKSGENWSYTYDAQNRMTGVTGPGVNETYAYDDSGQRIKKTEDAKTTYYFFKEYEETNVVTAPGMHFTDLVEAVVSGNTVSNPRLDWPAGAASLQKMHGDGGVVIEATETNKARMCGLSDSNASEHYGTIDYAFYLRSDGDLGIYENGANRGTFGSYATGDLLTIERTGSTIYYKRNNSTLRTVSAISSDLLVDMSIYSDNGTVKVNELYDSTHSYRDIVFDDLVNTTESDGNSIQKTGMQAWTVGAASADKIPGDGGMVIEATETNKSRMCGLSDGNINAHYNTIDYAFYLAGGGVLRIYENGANLGDIDTYVTGDLLKIERTGNRIHYLRNGVLLRDTAAVDGNLVVDMSFGTGGATIKIEDIFGNIGSNEYIKYYIANDQRIAQQYSEFTEYEQTTATEVENSIDVHPFQIGDLVNVTALSGNEIRKNSWDGGAATNKVIPENGGAHFRANGNTTARMFGLSDNNTNASYSTIDYAIYLMSNGNFRIYENGVNQGDFGSYVDGDIFTVERRGGFICYKKGLNVIRSTPAVTGTLLVDMSIYSDSANVKIEKVYALVMRDFQWVEAGILGMQIQDMVNVTAGGLNGQYSITKTGGNAWQAGAASHSLTTIYCEGGVIIEATETNKSRMVGLSDSNVNEHYSTIDYAFYMESSGNLKIYENGANRGTFGTYTTGDNLTIERRDGNILYKKNGVLIRSTPALSSTLRIDMSFGTPGSTVRIAGFYSLETQTSTSTQTVEAVQNVLQFFIKDHLGSSSVMVNKNGQNPKYIRYKPYGAVQHADDPDITKYQYTGQENDFDTGLYYYNARYYDPDLCRFIQADSVLDGLNRYTYCHNNPIIYTDPTGMITTDEEISKYILANGGDEDDVNQQLAIINFDWDNPDFNLSQYFHDYIWQKGFGYDNADNFGVEEKTWERETFSFGSNGTPDGMLCSIGATTTKNPFSVFLASVIALGICLDIVFSDDPKPIGVYNWPQLVLPVDVEMASGDKGKEGFRGGKKGIRDPQLKGFPNDFKRWFHREYKEPGGPQHTPYEEILVAYEIWKLMQDK
ncbi:MAG: VCBS repeat-containing protein [Spirochaetales bacterium]|nr:VCBS repeat-containing protein [Spirochaetales bacterium]